MRDLADDYLKNKYICSGKLTGKDLLSICFNVNLECLQIHSVNG